MGRIVAYLRVSTDQQDLENQRFEIKRYIEHAGIKQAIMWTEDVASGTRKAHDRNLGGVLDSLESGDTLIVSEVSRLARRVLPVMNIIQNCIDRGVTIVAVKEGYTFGNDINSKVIAFAFGIAAEIERNMISARTKEALARKRSEGVRLGRPTGSTKPEHYKLHGNDKVIVRYMDKGVSYSAIARLLDVNRKTLRSYVDRQNLRDQLRWKRYTETDV
jgi:putative DNA-invertase from lambdoid prophage Rac